HLVADDRAQDTAHDAGAQRPEDRGDDACAAPAGRNRAEARCTVHYVLSRAGRSRRDILARSGSLVVRLHFLAHFSRELPWIAAFSCRAPPERSTASATRAPGMH